MKLEPVVPIKLNRNVVRPVEVVLERFALCSYSVVLKMKIRWKMLIQLCAWLDGKGGMKCTGGKSFHPVLVSIFP